MMLIRKCGIFKLTSKGNQQFFKFKEEILKGNICFPLIYMSTFSYSISRKSITFLEEDTVSEVLRIRLYP
jgi:hypothetical protein